MSERRITNDTLRSALDVSWDQQSGLDVENYIKDRLDANQIDSTSYDSNSQTFIATNKLGEKIIDTQISVMKAIYNATMSITGIYVDGLLVKGTVNYKSGSKYELGVILNTTVTIGSGKPSKTTTPVACLLSVNSGGELYFSGISKTVRPSEEAYLIDITDIIKTLTTTNTVFTLEYTLKNESTGDVIISASSEPYSIVNPKIRYSENNYVVTQPGIKFNLLGVPNADKSKFKYQYFINGQEDTSVTGDTYTLTLQGRYDISARAIFSDDIKTEWEHISVIYINQTSKKQLQGTYVILNLLPTDVVLNLVVSNLYTVDVYSSDNKKVIIKTYIESKTPVKDTDLSNIIEVLEVEKKDYNKSNIYSSNFKKYIELSTKGDLYLGIKYTIDGTEKVYTFPEIVDADNIGTIYESILSYIITVSEPDDKILPYSDSIPSLNFSQSTGRSNNVFVGLNEKAAVENGYKLLNGKTTYFVSAQNEQLYEKGYIDTGINVSNDFSLEVGLTSTNVSSEDSPILTLGKIQIKPTEVCWEKDPSDSNNTIYLLRNAGYNVDEDTHIVITLLHNFSIRKGDPYYPDYLRIYQSNFDSYNGSFTLLKIYINGVVAREIILTGDSVNGEVTQIGNQLVINPKSSDVYFSCLKVFNNHALSEEEVRQEFIAFLPSKEEKQDFYEKNNILKDDGEISFKKARKHFNTLVYVYPKGFTLPSRAYGGEDNEGSDEANRLKKIESTLFVNYAVDAVNKKFGGRLSKSQRKPQGSSAQRYLHFNELDYFDKLKDGEGNKIPSEFITYENLKEDNTFKENPIITKKGLLLPATFSGTDLTTDNIVVSKLVGKVNWASSMQSHKLGACELYNATRILDSNFKGRKAVKELPFLAFYYVSDLDDISNIELKELLENDDLVKYQGLMTWGSGKCDKNTFDCGDKDVLVIEGAENEDYGTSFLVPWMAYQRAGNSLTPTVEWSTEEELLEDPLNDVLFYDESLFYGHANRLQASWDVDTNTVEVDDLEIINKFNQVFPINDDHKLYTITDEAKVSFKKWRAFYDFVYENDYSYVVRDSLDLEDQSKKICLSSTYDLYRYDRMESKWVPAGKYYKNGTWQTLNLREFLKNESGYTSRLSPEGLRPLMKAKFKRELGNYIDTQDLAHHLAVIRYLSGTDNRAKNTYFKVRADGLILMYLDDLDTVMITDNQGKQSKPYNLLEPSYDESLKSYWGDYGKNLLFRNFDIVFEEEIKVQLRNVCEKAPQILNDYFYAVQEYFPAVSYNHTARMYYELGLLIKDSEALRNPGANGSFYKNNGEEPITQSHGRYLEGERYFMNKRHNFLASYSLAGTYNTSDLILADAGGSGNVFKGEMEISTFLDMYPTIYTRTSEGEGGNHYIIEKPSGSQESNLTARRIRVGEIKKEVKVNEAQAILMALPLTSLYKTLKIQGYSRNILNGKFSHLVSLTIDNESARKNGYEETNLLSITGEFPVLEELNLIGLSMPSKFDMLTYIKLKSINLSKCTGLTEVILPKNLALETIVLPESIEELNLSNNPSIKNVTLEGWDNLKSLTVGNNSKLDTTELFKNITKPLKDITINLNINVSEEVANYILDSLNISIGTGYTVFIINSDGTSKDISYTTSLKIYSLKLNNFNYLNSDLQGIIITPEITINEPTDLLTRITIRSGNKIKEANPRITKTGGGGSLSGTIVTGNSSEERGIFSITLGGTTGTMYVNYKENEPTVGSFAYADGLFSTIYDSKKDLVGLVYAYDLKNQVAYIIGKEFTKSQPCFVGLELVNRTLYLDNDQKYMSNAYFDANTQYPDLVSGLKFVKIDENGDGNDTGPTLLQDNFDYKYFEGKLNTYNILLSSLSTDNINDNCFNTDSSANGPYANYRLLYSPYYQSAKLYSPKVNGVLNDLYKVGNWYVPNKYEWGQVLQQYACSHQNRVGQLSNSDFAETNINKNAVTTNNIEPIFTYAANQNCTSEAWNNIINNSRSCLVTSSLLKGGNDTSRMNSLFFIVNNPYAGQAPIYLWVSPYYTTNYDYNNNSSAGWCGHAHKCIPFVQFNWKEYKNNSTK